MLLKEVSKIMKYHRMSCSLVCFYDEDMNNGKPTQEWVGCPSQDCAKWIHEDCVEKDEFECMICPLCNAMFN